MQKGEAKNGVFQRIHIQFGTEHWILRNNWIQNNGYIYL